MSNSESVKADEILKIAEQVLTKRGQLRDLPQGERSMPEIVKLFAQLSGVELTVSEGYTFMMALKLVRLKRKPLFDDFIDLINYTALRGEDLLANLPPDASA